MNCRYCHRPLSHTFASLFHQRQLHFDCEQLLKEQENITVYPFLEGLIYVDYLVDVLPKYADEVFLQQHCLTSQVQRMMKENMLSLFLTDMLSSEDLYLLYILSNQRLYWVFLERPSFLE